MSLLAPAQAQSEGVVREGSGARRAALDAMELTRFDRSLLGGLTDWVGEPVTADDLDGKPVLVLTWASWHPGSTASARAAQLMSRSYGDQGLIILGVHAEEGFDTAASTAERLRLDFPIARDAGSAFREAIKADMDPNFYVIDRAGQVRFADVDRGSIRQAVKTVVEESREQAETAASRRGSNEQGNQGRVILDVTRGDVADIPEWDIPQQDALLYQEASWPARWLEAEREFDADFRRSGNNELPIVNFNSDLVTWLSPKPNMGGRIRVAYFWSHTLPGSYQRVQPMMDDLQRTYGRDVAVMGVAVPVIRVDQEQASRNPAVVEDALESFAQNLSRVVTDTQLRHTIVFDREWELHSSTLGKEARGGRQSLQFAQQFKYPMVAIYSTDNTVRWIGTPLNDQFRLALNRIIETDPAVQIRRARDAAYLTRTGQR
ncbi:MAG: TlpA disulfide reductase family protein [Phycisphaerales bacterium]